MAEPLDACSPLLEEVEDGGDDTARIVLIVRGKCAFEEKIRNAQEAGFRAAIVYDDRHNHNLVSSGLLPISSQFSALLEYFLYPKFLWS